MNPRLTFSSMAMIAVIAVPSISLAANSEEHLVPEDTVFSEDRVWIYDRLARSVFDEMFARNIRARVIVRPSFENDFALGIRENDGSYELLMWQSAVLQSSTSEMGSSGDQSSAAANGQGSTMIIQLTLPKSLENYNLPTFFRVRRTPVCETMVDDALAGRLLEVWKTALLATKYRIRDTLGLDGTTYHFSMRVEYEELAGKTWSPEPASNMGRLVTITEAMRTLCQQPSDNAKSKLKRLIKDLMGRL